MVEETSEETEDKAKKEEADEKTKDKKKKPKKSKPKSSSPEPVGIDDDPKDTQVVLYTSQINIDKVKPELLKLRTIERKLFLSIWFQNSDLVTGAGLFIYFL